jgi:predicted CopG family antitoxin
MVTTIQLSEETKMTLAKLKRNSETYENVILRLMQNNAELLKEGYQNTPIEEEWDDVDAWD